MDSRRWGLTEEEQAIVEAVARWVDQEVRPHAGRLERANEYPAGLIDQMKEMGVFGLAVPARWTDSAVSARCFALVTVELARGWMSLAGAMGGHSVVARLIAEYGTPEQQEHWLPRMATGEVRAAMALTEPNGGSDLQDLRTRAVRDDDDYVVDGSKTWITNARHAGVIATLVKTDPAAEPRHTGISVGNLLADMATKVRAARLLLLDAAASIDAGERSDLEAGMAKLFASEAAMQVALDAMRIHGAAGYSAEIDVERYFRDAPLMIVGEGTNEIQRNVIVRQLIARTR